MNFAALKSGVLVAALSSVAFAQTTIRTTTTLVVVPTLVQTPGKELVFSLKADDFILTDNGVPQKVTLEEETNRPLSLVVLMQTGGMRAMPIWIRCSRGLWARLRTGFRL
jgi:hypothetical protein